ncbi:MAG: HD domain-containing phosphohydrolase [Planctomycetota bacterium]
MINRDVNIKATTVYIVGHDDEVRSFAKFFNDKGFDDVTQVADDARERLYETAMARTVDDRRICMVVYFVGDITEVRTIQRVASLENCGLLPVVKAEAGDISYVLLQKTDIKNVEQQPLDFETAFLKVEKILIRLHMQKRIIESNQTNREFFLKILRVMNKLLEERDVYTEHHSENVAHIACAIAERYGLAGEDLHKLEMAGFLHDFGKIGITDRILNKPGKLTREEYDVIKKHPLIAQVILEPVQDLKDILPWIKHHHERWDGAGYPDGLKGGAIPLAARILAVADAYDTMHSRRTYHDPFSDEYIRTELVNGRERQFDPDVVTLFMEILDEKALGILT